MVLWLLGIRAKRGFMSQAIYVMECLIQPVGFQVGLELVHSDLQLKYMLIFTGY
jgi:hypothetical protein